MVREPDLIIGVGNPWSHDDGMGQAVAQACAARSPRATEVVLLDGEPSRLIDAWTERRRVVVVDACASGHPPGSVFRFELGTDELPRGTNASSSHSAGIAEAVLLGEALGQQPGSLVLFCVEGADFRDGPGLSPALAAVVEDVASQVLADLALPEGSRRVPR
jgi:hydrogenase maturation protease